MWYCTHQTERGLWDTGSMHSGPHESSTPCRDQQCWSLEPLRDGETFTSLHFLEVHTCISQHFTRTVSRITRGETGRDFHNMHYEALPPVEIARGSLGHRDCCSVLPARCVEKFAEHSIQLLLLARYCSGLRIENFLSNSASTHPSGSEWKLFYHTLRYLWR